MTLIAPGVARFSVHGVILGRPWTNVLDMHIDSGGLGSRDNNVADQAKVILNNYIDHLRAFWTNQMTMTGCRWVDLDSAAGTTGEATVATAPRVMPAVGTSAADALPASVSWLVKKQVQAGRGKRTGRIYLCGFVESANTAGKPTAADVATIQTALNNLLSGINQSGATSFGGYDSDLVVVHTAGGAFVSRDHVNTLQAQPVWATQRRRVRP